MSASSSLAKRPIPPLSYINYYFDFESAQTRAVKTPNRTSAAAANPKYGQKFEWDQDIDVIRPSSSLLNTQRGISYPQDVEFYSISFDLNLESVKPRHETSSYNETAWSEPLRANLFTMNTFDDLTTNRIFMFGVNLLMSPRTGKFDLEIFTNKHTIKTNEPVMLNNRRTSLNLTFTSTYIELRVNSDEEATPLQPTLRLTDRYFSLLLRPLLKAYGAFQLNATSFETDSSPGSMHLLNACMSNFRLATRRTTNNQLVYYSLLEQTKSISYYQSDYYSDLSFDTTCSGGGGGGSSGVSGASSAYVYKYPRLIQQVDKCYQVTRVDVLTSQKVEEFTECECNSTKLCSYKKWTNFTKSAALKIGSIISHDDEMESVTCSQAANYACFNNATCVDVSLSPSQAFTCKCVGSYTGDRFVLLCYFFFQVLSLTQSIFWFGFLFGCLNSFF